MDTQQELTILLAAIARELRRDPAELPLELEVVAGAALAAAYNKGVAQGASSSRARRLSETIPVTAEDRSELPTEPPPPPPPGATNAGVYMFVERPKKVTPR